MKVIIKGYYGAKNLGDDFILLSIIDMLGQKDISIDIISHGDNYEELRQKYIEVPIRIINVNDSVNRGLCKIKRIAESDFFIIGGGGLFPGESISTAVKTLFNVLIARLNHTSVCIYGVEISSMENKLYRFLWKIILFYVDFFAARNQFTYKAMSSLKTKTPVYSLSDVTFAFEEDSDSKCSEIEKSILWALAMPWSNEELKDEKCYNRYVKFCTQIANCIKKLSILGYKNYFQPFNYNSDMKLINDLSGMLNFKLHVIDTQEMMFVDRRKTFKKASFIVAMRYHAVLFSIFYGKPFVSISYSPKITNLLLENGFKENYIEFGVRDTEFFGKAFDMNEEQLISIIKKSIENSKNIRLISNQASQNLKKLATDEKRLLTDWLSG